MNNTAFNLTPLFRSSIGFDRFNDLFETAFKGEEIFRLMAKRPLMGRKLNKLQLVDQLTSLRVY